jgi:V/A-type H+/Na+-transporting ATPase subunit K
MIKRSYWRIGPVAAALTGAILVGTAMAQEAVRAGAASADPASAMRSVGFALGAALAIGFSVLGAGYAVGRIGSAALGLGAEKPELLTRSILFVALAEGLAVLGFAIAMMLVQKI